MAAWWQEGVDGGRIVPDTGSTETSTVLADAVAWSELHKEAPPTSTSLGEFVKTKVAPRRKLVEGRRVWYYALLIRHPPMAGPWPGSQDSLYTCNGDSDGGSATFGHSDVNPGVTIERW